VTMNRGAALALRVALSLGLAAIAGGIILVGLAVLFSRGERTVADLRAVHSGMTKREVVDLLGRPLGPDEIPRLARDRVERYQSPCSDRVLYREQLRNPVARYIHNLVLPKGADFWQVCFDRGVVRDRGPIGPILRSRAPSEGPSNNEMQLTKRAQAMELRS